MEILLTTLKRLEPGGLALEKPAAEEGRFDISSPLIV